MKHLVLLALLCCSYLSYAQEPHPCAQSRMQNTLPPPLAEKTRYQNADIVLLNQYDVSHYDIRLSMSSTSTYLEGFVAIKVKIMADPLDTFAIELYKDFTVDSITHNLQQVPFSRKDNMLYAAFPQALPQHSLQQFVVHYHGTGIDTSLSFKKGIMSFSGGYYPNGLTFTHTEPYFAHLWIPCKQIVSDKADSADLHITTQLPNKVASNGKLMAVDTLPNNTVRYHWKTTYPIAHYLLFVGVGDFVIRHRMEQLIEQDSTLCSFYHSNAFENAYALSLFDSTGIYLKRLSEQYGLYPFYREKYGQCLTSVNDGMEHQTMVTMGSNYYRLSVIIHEMAHHWFGNQVTCKSWSDIAVNEGFATFVEVSNLHYADTLWKTLFKDITSKPNGSVYRTDTTTNAAIFDSRLSYHKGAYVLRTLGYVIGNENLLEGLRSYLQIYSGKSAGIDEFREVAESVSSQDLRTFFDEWFYGEGFPHYKMNYNFDSTALVVKLNQTTSMPSSVPFFHTPLKLKLQHALYGDTTVVLIPDSAQQTFVIPLHKPIQSLSFDPKDSILKKKNPGDLYRDPLIAINDYYLPDQKNPAFFFYPNPVHDWLTINPNFSFKQADLFDLFGNTVYSGKSHTIDLRAVQTGLYLLKCTTEQDTIERKVMVRH